jgi:YggT family protein
VEAYLIGLVDLIVTLITVLLILNILASYVLDPFHPARRFLNQLSEPLLRPFRGLLPPAGMFDFTIMIALIVIRVLGELLKLLIRSSFG